MAQCELSSEAAREEIGTLVALFGQAEAPNNGTQMVAFRRSATAGPDEGRKRRCGRKEDESGNMRRKIPDLAAEEGRGIGGASGTLSDVAAEVFGMVRTETASQIVGAKA